MPRRSKRIASQSTSTIVEIQNIEEVLDFVDKDTAFAWDVDNTLYEPLNSIFPGDIWFEQRVLANIASGDDVPTAVNKVLPLYIAAQHKTKVKVCESEVVSLIEQLQAQGLINFALTSRGDEILAPTMEQLASVGIDFNQSIFKDTTIDLGASSHRQASQGVIFCSGGRAKGPCFEKTMEALKWQPKRLVFIDDKQDYLESVKATCEKLGIQFVGLRYAFMDPQKALFDKKIFAIQEEFFKNPILSDEVALIIHQARNQAKSGLIPNFDKNECLLWSAGNLKDLHDKICALAPDRMKKDKTLGAEQAKPYRRAAKYFDLMDNGHDVLCNRFKIPFSEMIELIPRMVEAEIISQEQAQIYTAMMQQALAPQAAQHQQAATQTPGFDSYRSRLRSRAEMTSPYTQMSAMTNNQDVASTNRSSMKC